MEDVCDFIHVKRNGIDGTAYPLTKQLELVLGKSESCDFRVQVPSACDRHAKLRVDKAGKVYVSSLVPTVPVILNGEQVMKEAYIADKSVITVGTCNFRFVYREGFRTSPLQEENRMVTTPIKPKKSPGTPKSSSRRDKENVISPHSHKKTSLRTPCNTPVVSSRPGTPTVGKKTPATPQPRKSATPTSAKQKGNQDKVTRPLTPISAPSSKKKQRVDTPIHPRHSSTWSTRSSLSSSLFSISEEEPTPTTRAMKTPTSTSNKEKSTTPSEKVKRVVTPVARCRKSSRSRASSCSMSTSLMSIQEEDESVAVSPSPSTASNKSHRHLYTSRAITPRMPVVVPSAKRAKRKSVSFGPALSPEVFNKRMPPNTPVKAGTVPGGIQRSLPDNLAKSDILELVTEEEEEDGEEEEREGEDEMVEYSMTGFEETSSEEDSSEDEEGEPEIEVTPVGTVAQPPTLPTPLKRQICSKAALRRLHRKLDTPLRRAIEGKPRLRALRKRMPTPLRKAIEERPSLRKNCRALPTPIRSGIQNPPGLRKTRRVLNTPLRKQIQSTPKLRKTKRSMPTPLRKAIEHQPPLRKTRKAMPTPLRRAIEEKPALRKTMKSMPTPVRSEIEGRPTLRRTRKALATPVRKEIEEMPKLRKTKKLMPTPIRREIQSRPVLHKTKQSLPTPLREEIQSRPLLRKTKKSLPTPLRAELETEHVLRKTKRTLPTPLRTAIQQCPALRATKKSLPAKLLLEIASNPQLRPTKRKMATPLREEIQRGVELRTAHPQLAIKTRSKRVYTETITACETPVPAPPAKRRKVYSTPLPYTFVSDTQPSVTPDVVLKPTPTKRSKRGYAKTVTDFETPVPLPPAKKMKTAGSPALSTPLPYNFEQFIKPSKKSPGVDLTGLQRLFHSPRVCNSTDPSDVFEVRLFGEPREVSFASPVVLSAKKSSSRPNSAQALYSCLKKIESPLFNMGTAEPRPQRRSQRTRKNTRSAAAAAVCTRVTRSRSRAEVPSSEPASRKRRSTINESSGKENASSPPTKRVVRSTRSRAITVDNLELSSSTVTVPPMTTRRCTRSTKTDTPTLPTHTVSTRSNTHSLDQKSKPDEKPAQTLHIRLTRRQAKQQVGPPPQNATQAEKPEPAAVTETNERCLRSSRRQGPAPAQQDQAIISRGRKASSQKKPQAEEGVTIGRRTRQAAAKQVPQAAVETQAAKPSTRSSHGKKEDTSTAPLRRSSRLRK